MPDAFMGTDLDEVRARAGEDPRLANALASGDDGRVTHFVAGALALLKRYDLAPVGARAVIEAAMDARRLGHGPVLRQAFLEEAADAYLTDHESDTLHNDWFEQALVYASTHVHGTVAPLTRIRPRRRARDTTRNNGHQPTYRLADYLEQHAHHTRRRFCPRTSFWDATHEHAHTTEDLLNLADAARARLRLRHAQRLYDKVAAARDPRALMSLAELRDEAGDQEGAERWYREAADAGSTNALSTLGRIREAAGDLDEAERLYHQVVNTQLERIRRSSNWRAGDPLLLSRTYHPSLGYGGARGLLSLVQARERMGDRDGGERLAREVADTGDTHALTTLAQYREETNDHNGAERVWGWLRNGLDADDAPSFDG
ncbi:tetratricopeptide repeat protein [Embleya sp. NPDC020630]|uniref:tetratricopeptide repeat protein n=1 Tax=Embleya sp. NPDC020630 TaxID=3363979 RepID=UPI003791E17A